MFTTRTDILGKCRINYNVLINTHNNVSDAYLEAYSLADHPATRSYDKVIRGIPWEARPFVCSQCDRRFTAKRSLMRHLRYECGKTPRFECPYCDYRTKRSYNGTAHIKARHPDQPVYLVHIEQK